MIASLLTPCSSWPTQKARPLGSGVLPTMVRKSASTMSPRYSGVMEKACATIQPSMPPSIRPDQ